MVARTKSLTTRTIKIYKAVITVLFAAFILALLYWRFTEGSVFGIFMVAPYFFFIYRLWRGIKLLKEVSYDDHSLYVKEKEFEIEIPMYRVRNIELVSLDGIYKFELHDTDQFGDTVYCKPSIWYPFTYKWVDDELRKIRKMVAKEKEKYWEARQSDSGPALSGMNI